MALVLRSILLIVTINSVAQPPEAPVAVQRGMRPAEVRQLLGPPVRIARQALYRRHIEQWVYENPQAIRVVFNCVRGEEPIVTAVLPSRPSGPARGN
jgi:hypothetical protein